MGTHCARVIQAIFILGNSHLGIKTVFYEVEEVIGSICARNHDNEEERNETQMKSLNKDSSVARGT